MFGFWKIWEKPLEKEKRKEKWKKRKSEKK